MGCGERVAETACVREDHALTSRGKNASSPLTSQGEILKNLRVCFASICPPISEFFRMQEPHRSGILFFVERLRQMHLASWRMRSGWPVSATSSHTVLQHRCA